MSKVFYGSTYVKNLRPKSTLPGKLESILEKLDLAAKVKDKRVCIKMHMGGSVGYSTIHPVFVRKLVSFIKSVGGRPFITDVSPSAMSAHERGYSRDTVGCPVLPASGSAEKYVYKQEVNYKSLKEVPIAGELWDSEVLVVLSHAKGHGCTGFGGAIKNIGIGGLAGPGRGAVHMLEHHEPYWNPELCTHFTEGCTACIDACKLNTMRFADDGLLHLGFHECNFCMECNKACPTGGLKVSEVASENFQEGMCRVAQLILSRYKKEAAVFINFAVDITPFCDCMGITTPSLVQDVGILASDDIVAVEQATLDMIGKQELLPNTLPGVMVMREDVKGHLFHKIHGVDPYLQVQTCERLGLGTRQYEIEEVG